MNKMPLSPKYKDFLKTRAKAEFLEGTTAAGKTTVGAVKFMLQVAKNSKKLHILSGLDLETIEKNIIAKDLGILEVFAGYAEYNPNGKGDITLPHLLYTPEKGVEKVILVLGYDNKKRWQKALGGQYGCLYIDEINIADMDYVREAVMRCDYLMATLNPDNPDLPVYREYVNCRRPLPRWEKDTPQQILQYLKEPAKEGWVHWFFSFEDNLGLSREKKNQIINSVAPGTKQYKNKIQGLRGRTTGLVFNLQDKNIISEEKAKEFEYTIYTIGVDTSYSQNSKDTFAFVFGGITRDKRYVTLDEQVYNNADLKVHISPSAVPPLIVAFAEKNREKYGFARDIFIDSADRATIMECEKYKRENGSIYNFLPAWKKTKIIDRINLQRGWMARGDFLITDICKNSIREYNSYSWQEDKYRPEDGNDHTINANQYAFLPFVNKIGNMKDKKNNESD